MESDISTMIYANLLSLTICLKRLEVLQNYILGREIEKESLKMAIQIFNVDLQCVRNDWMGFQIMFWAWK
jgi:hypothetical protein